MKPPPRDAATPPLPADMAKGAAEMQARLEQARSRLKRATAPTPPRDDEE